MTVFQAAVLGVVQGLTEFLPISSTAHLRVVPALLRWEDPGAAFTAVIQLGTLLAVFLYFRRDIVRLGRAALDGVRRGDFSSPDARLVGMIVAGTVPIVVCGVLFKDDIETHLRSLYVISVTSIVLALFLAAAEALMARRQRLGRPGKQMASLTWADGLAAGLAQALALIPGASRSGVTITAGLFTGLTRETAARFSFLLSLPSVFAAGVFQLVDAREELLASERHAAALLVATAVSGVVGYASIAFLLGYLRRHTTYLFVAYRLLTGGGLLALLWSGRLAP
jgi:undecaprenyl-diphosphatase